jgi:hypothetical protein
MNPRLQQILDDLPDLVYKGIYTTKEAEQILLAIWEIIAGHIVGNIFENPELMGGDAE